MVLTKFCPKFTLKCAQNLPTIFFEFCLAQSSVLLQLSAHFPLKCPEKVHQNNPSHRKRTHELCRFVERRLRMMEKGGWA